MMARWTRCVGLFTAALVVVGLVTAAIFWRQLGVMQGQLDEAKAERRPWIAFDETIEILRPLSFDESGAHGAIRITIRNGGRSIATNVSGFTRDLLIRPVLSPGMHSAQEITDSLLRFQTPICLLPDANRRYQFGLSLLPGASHDIDPGQQEIGRIDAPRNTFIISSDGMVQAWMPICVIYKDDAGEPHATNVIYGYVTEDNRREFPPNGQISGKFTVLGIGASAY